MMPACGTRVNAERRARLWRCRGIEPNLSSSRRPLGISRSGEDWVRWIASLCLVAAVAGGAGAQTTYDLVIANGRVMDPASGLDAVRHIGIRGGKIATVSATPLKGTRVIA